MPKGGEVDLGPAAGGSRGWPRPQESAEQCSGGQREASYGEKVKKIVVHQQSGQAGQAGETAQRAKEAGTMSLIELERQIEKCGAQIEKQRPAEEGAHGAPALPFRLRQQKIPRNGQEKGDGHPCQDLGQHMIGLGGKGEKRRGVVGYDQQRGRQAEPVQTPGAGRAAHSRYSSSVRPRSAISRAKGTPTYRKCQGSQPIPVTASLPLG